MNWASVSICRECWRMALFELFFNNVHRAVSVPRRSGLRPGAFQCSSEGAENLLLGRSRRKHTFSAQQSLMPPAADGSFEPNLLIAILCCVRSQREKRCTARFMSLRGGGKTGRSFSAQRAKERQGSRRGRSEHLLRLRPRVRTSLNRTIFGTASC